jgi:hypothetical protein
MGESGGAGGGTSSQQELALLPPYTTGRVRIRSNLDIKLGARNRRGGNGELQIEAARRGARTRQEARAGSTSRSSAAWIAREKLGSRPRVPAHSSGWTGGIVEAVVAEGCAGAAA